MRRVGGTVRQGRHRQTAEAKARNQKRLQLEYFLYYLIANDYRGLIAMPTSARRIDGPARVKPGEQASNWDAPLETTPGRALRFGGFSTKGEARSARWNQRPGDHMFRKASDMGSLDISQVGTGKAESVQVQIVLDTQLSSVVPGACTQDPDVVATGGGLCEFTEFFGLAPAAKDPHWFAAKGSGVACCNVALRCCRSVGPQQCCPSRAGPV
jgi:hypothetical protein